MQSQSTPLPYDNSTLTEALLSYLFSTLLAYSFESLRIRQKVSSDFGLDRFRMLIENSSDAIAIMDHMTNLLYVSPAYERMFGYSPEETLGYKGISLVHPEDRMHCLKILGQSMMDKHHVYKARYRFRKKNGDWASLETAGRFFIGNNGQPYAILNTRDMSEQEELEDQLRHSQKMQAIGTLVGGIAHNVNNMLAAIVSNVYLAERANRDNPVVDSKLQQINTLSMKVRDMIAQLLTFARKNPVQMRNIIINDVFSEACTMMGSLLPGNVLLRQKPAPQALAIYGDASQLQQMIVNLLTNARDAVTEREQPVIDCSLDLYIPDEKFRRQHDLASDARLAHLSIGDNGHGIKDQDLERIFDPFFTTKNVGQGYGLGLSTVHGAVKMHHGIITVESSLLSGTCFHVYFPLMEILPGEQHNSSFSDNWQGRNERLLLVDDSADMREPLALTLESLGYRVLQAENVNQAVELLQAQVEPVEMIIMDLVIPGSHASKAAEQLRQRETTPMIFFSGYDKDDVLQNHELPEHSILLGKPLPIDALAQHIRHLLDEKSASAPTTLPQ